MDTGTCSSLTSKLKTQKSHIAYNANASVWLVLAAATLTNTSSVNKKDLNSI